MSIIFNTDEIKKLSNFNVEIEPILFILKDENERFERESNLNLMYKTIKTDRLYNNLRAVTGMEGFRPSTDLGVSDLADISESFPKVLTDMTWKRAFVVSKNAQEDNQDADISASGLGFIRAFGRTKERFGAGMFSGALTGKLVFEGATFDCTGADTVDGDPASQTKQIYFHKSHKPAHISGVTQSNKFRADIDLTDPQAPELMKYLIGQVETKMRGYRADKGEILNVSPTYIIHSGQNYLLKEAIETGLKSVYGSTMGANGVNIQYGKWTVVENIYLSEFPGYTEDKASFLMFDKTYNDEVFGSVWIDRVPLTVRTYIKDETEALVFDGRSRFSAGFSNWRPWAYVDATKLAEGEVLNTVANSENATPIDLPSRVTKVEVVNSEAKPVNTKEVA